MFVKMFIIFIKSIILLKQEEYTFTSKLFNPVKIFAMLFLYSSLVLSIYLVYKLMVMYQKLLVLCPNLFT